MMCPKCNDEMELFGVIYIIESNKKYKKTFEICRRHIPYTPVTLVNKEQVI